MPCLPRDNEIAALNASHTYQEDIAFNETRFQVGHSKLLPP